MGPLQAGQYDEEELPAHEPPRARVQYTSLGDPVCDLECWDDVEAEL